LTVCCGAMSGWIVQAFHSTDRFLRFRSYPILFRFLSCELTLSCSQLGHRCFGQSLAVPSLGAFVNCAMLAQASPRSGTGWDEGTSRPKACLVKVSMFVRCLTGYRWSVPAASSKHSLVYTRATHARPSKGEQIDDGDDVSLIGCTSCSDSVYECCHAAWSVVCVSRLFP
jgi:hypothetical protein